MFDLFIYQEMRNIRRQHHISKEVILDWSAFVNVQDSHPYVAIGKISAETRRFFVALAMPLSVQMLFRPTIADLCHMFNFSTINYYWVFIPITTYNHDLSFADIQPKTKGLAFGFHNKQ